MLSLGYAADALYGGHMLCVRSGQDFVFFYDWESGSPVRRIDVAAKAVHWSESGSLCAIASADSVFVLKYDQEAVDQYLASGAEEEDGCEGAFEPEYE